MSTEKEEVEVVRGLLPVEVGGETRLLPELKWRANRGWQDRLEAKFVEMAAVPADTPDGLRAMADAERELVLAYDTTGVLGDLEDASEREIDAIYERLLEVAYPLADSARAIMLAVARRAVLSVLPSSTSGPSPTGDTEAPTTSKPRSRSGRSASSTPRLKSA